MNAFTGRPTSDRARKIGKGIFEGLSLLGTALADGPKHDRIKEIDAEIERLQHERDTLIASLIEPGDLKVSKGYDPNKAVVIHNVRPGEGRLTQCPGRSTSSAYDRCHPGCPYNSKIHGAHEFTLRD
jgi:hypothetical protein